MVMVIIRAVLVGVTNGGNVGGDGVTDTTEKDKGKNNRIRFNAF